MSPVSTTSRSVANISPNSFSCVRFWKKNHLCTTCCLLSVTWTLWTDSAMQRHLNYHRHEPRDLEHRLFHTVLLITNSSYVISCLIFLLIYCMYILFFRIISLLLCTIAAIQHKPFYYHLISHSKSRPVPHCRVLPPGEFNVTILE